VSLEYAFYVSSCQLDQFRAPDEIRRLVEHSRQANARNGLTGSLIFSGLRFAQYLEGPPESLQWLMSRISVDTRHHQITMLRQGTSKVRQFNCWSLSYSGPSLYVDRQLQRLVGRCEELHTHSREIEQLLRLKVSLKRFMETRPCDSPRNRVVSNQG
jgi:hypothetical protein